MTERFVRVNAWIDRNPKVIVTAALIAFLAFVGLIVTDITVNHQQNHRLNRLAAAGKNAHDALCVFRTDLERRVEASREFLREHPGGIAGIDRDTFVSSINNQQQTLDALSVLRCAKGGEGE